MMKVKNRKLLKIKVIGKTLTFSSINKKPAKAGFI